MLREPEKDDTRLAACDRAGGKRKQHQLNLKDSQCAIK